MWCCPDPGEQRAEDLRRLQVRGGMKVEIEQRAGDHGQRELRVGEPEVPGLTAEPYRHAGAEPRELAAGDPGQVSCRRHPKVPSPESESVSVIELLLDDHSVAHGTGIDVNQRMHHGPDSGRDGPTGAIRPHVCAI